MTWRQWRRLLLPTRLLTATTLSACSDVLTGPGKEVDLGEWGACFLCGGPGSHPGIQTPLLLDTTPPSTDAYAITVEVRPGAQ